jgi:septal ring factor EnvC (AmiA/AmiB activator)
LLRKEILDRESRLIALNNKIKKLVDERDALEAEIAQATSGLGKVEKQQASSEIVQVIHARTRQQQQLNLLSKRAIRFENVIGLLNLGWMEVAAKYLLQRRQNETEAISAFDED